MNKLVGVGIGVAAAIIIGVGFAVSSMDSDMPELVDLPTDELEPESPGSVSIELNESIGFTEKP